MCIFYGILFDSAGIRILWTLAPSHSLSLYIKTRGAFSYADTKISSIACKIFRYNRTPSIRIFRQKARYVRLSICIYMPYYVFIGKMDGGENWRRANPHLYTHARTQTCLLRTMFRYEAKKGWKKVCFVCAIARLWWCAGVAVLPLQQPSHFVSLSLLLDREARENGGCVWPHLCCHMIGRIGRVRRERETFHGVIIVCIHDGRRA